MVPQGSLVFGLFYCKNRMESHVGVGEGAECLSMLQDLSDDVNTNAVVNVLTKK